MATAAGIEHVVGGNIGQALLGRLDEIGPGTTVILEISHTQLQYTDRSPAIAAITNVTPNHLDQFSWEQYVGLKRNILLHQSQAEIAVLNIDDKTSRGLVTDVHGRLLRTSLQGPVEGDGAWLDRGVIAARVGRRPVDVIERSRVQLRGEHNTANVVMATAIAMAAGWPVSAIAAAAQTFRGVPHRLEVVGRAGGATWINDSIATSPERTIAGLQAFTEPVVLLLGGRDKHLPLDRLQQLAASRCRAVVCFGEARDLFCEALSRVVGVCQRVETLPDAVAAAAALALPGDVVLLSPAGTSFDAFPTFEHRGEAFRQLVRALPGFTSEEVSP
jgi:UDP-N-acetylmuramoylalanine--D-glutamate ligase